MSGYIKGEHVHLKIQDEGRGISQKDLPKFLIEVIHQLLIVMKQLLRVWDYIWLTVLKHN